MQYFETGWNTDDGLRIYAQGWEPGVEPRAVVCLVHGLGEHSGRYGHVAAFITHAGYALFAFDMRGHGKSQGKHGHASSYGVLLDDISYFLEKAAERYTNLPSFLYGHSLGGTLVIEYALRRRPVLPGVIATGPSFRPAFEPRPWKITLGKIMYHLWPTLTLSNEIDREGLSRDLEVVRVYNNDPLVHDRLSTRLGIDLLERGLWVLEHADQIHLPLLLMHGGADRITSAEASREFAEQAGDLCTLRIWDDFYHEIHNEPEKEQVLGYMMEWLSGRT